MAGTGRWGGRASPHIGKDVGPAAQGETLGKPAFTSAPKTGSVGRELEGEKISGFKPAANKSGVNKEMLGEKRDSGNSKPPGEKPGSPNMAKKTDHKMTSDQPPGVKKKLR
jgi:hypothetical protein